MIRFFKETLPEYFRVAKLQRELIETGMTPQEQGDLLQRFLQVSKNVPCPHNPSHILAFVTELYRLAPEVKGSIVEAGAFRGGSTAKISIVAKSLGRPFHIFDSFEGLPPNEEAHDSSILGHSIKDWFREGEFCGSLEEVRDNVREYGEIEPCQFLPGWFEDTMPGFDDPIAAAYIDVDLASSTRTCLKYLYPRLSPGGVLMSQDGDFPLVMAVFDDDSFWLNEVGCEKPPIVGLGRSKILKVVKPAESP
jgi:O-methyltransferase